MTGALFPAVILAGGLGLRLRPVTEKLPKALVPIAGEPFLAHQLRLLRANGIERVVICIGHRGEMIRELAGDGQDFGLRIDYSEDGPRLLGTAGAVANALPLLGDQFFVLYGDSYLTCDYGQVQRAFQDSGAGALMTVFRNEGLWDTSNVEFDGGRILAYDKRQPTRRMHHIDYGLGVFHRRVFSESIPSDLADLYRSQLDQGDLAAFEVAERFYEIGSKEGVLDLEEYLSRQGASK